MSKIVLSLVYSCGNIRIKEAQNNQGTPQEKTQEIGSSQSTCILKASTLFYSIRGLSLIHSQSTWHHIIDAIHLLQSSIFSPHTVHFLSSAPPSHNSQQCYVFQMLLKVATCPRIFDKHPMYSCGKLPYFDVMCPDQKPLVKTLKMKICLFQACSKCSVYKYLDESKNLPKFTQKKALCHLMIVIHKTINT